MNESNRKLWDDVVNQSLNKSLNGANLSSECLEETMKLVDRDLELSKLDMAEAQQKQQADAEKKKSRRELIVKGIEIGAALILAPIVEFGCKKAYARYICNFEKDYTFTTTAGRGLSGLFHWKK